MSGIEVIDYNPESVIKLKELALEGLMTDGEHHKQWYLEEIIKALGYDLAEQRAYAIQQDYDWEPGIAP